MADGYIEEKHIDPMNILIVFLIGIASAVFIFASIKTLEIDNDFKLPFIIMIGIIYAIVVFAFLKPKTIRKRLPTPHIIREEHHIETPVIKIIEKPITKIVEKIVEKEVEKIVEKPVIKTIVQPLILRKIEKEKTKYVGSTHNEKYHLRTCRFAGAIKKKFLVEEKNKKFFRLRGYAPCKVCHPDKN